MFCLLNAQISGYGKFCGKRAEKLLICCGEIRPQNSITVNARFMRLYENFTLGLCMIDFIAQ